MQEITHRATVIKVEGNKIFLEIQSQEACATCPAFSLCAHKEGKDKIITLERRDADTFQTGDKLYLSISSTQGFYALLYGYLLPLALMLITLLTALFLGASELLAGGYSIMVLIPYYFVLFFLKKYFINTFQFRVKRL